MSRAVFLTGATGLIGRRVLAQALAETTFRMQCLVRSDAAPNPSPSRVEYVVGDLRNPSTYRPSLTGADVVVHLAAVTGKASMTEYLSVNVEGTRALVRACRDARVRRFILVSSIAATYPDNSNYPYGQSKTVAEQIVAGSGLEFLIVRPTLVFGADSPIWRALSRLARLPMTPVVGGGRVRVQPIYVDDVAKFLVWAMGQESLPNRAVDLGGADVVTFTELMRRIRRALGGHESRVVPVPARPFMAAVSWLERRAFAALPVSVGQFSAFLNDSVAADDPWVEWAMPNMMTLDAMLAALTRHD